MSAIFPVSIVPRSSPSADDLGVDPGRGLQRAHRGLQLGPVHQFPAAAALVRAEQVRAEPDPYPGGAGCEHRVPRGPGELREAAGVARREPHGRRVRDQLFHDRQRRHQRHAVLAHQRCGLLVDLRAVLDAPHPGRDRGPDTAVVVRVHGDVGALGAGFLDRDGDLGDGELGVAGLLGRDRDDGAGDQQLDERGAAAEAFADVLAQLVRAVREQRPASPGQGSRAGPTGGSAPTPRPSGRRRRSGCAPGPHCRILGPGIFPDDMTSASPRSMPPVSRTVVKPPSSVCLAVHEHVRGHRRPPRRRSAGWSRTARRPCARARR